MIAGYRLALDRAWNSWEKLFDSKQNAYYYYNKVSRQSQWFRPYLLGTKRGELPVTDYDYFQTKEYLTSRTKIHQVSTQEAENISRDAFSFGDKFSYPDEESNYVVYDVPHEILKPPAEWSPDPDPKDFGNTGLLSETTGDSNKWACPHCKYVNRAGLMRCEICEGAKPKEGEKQVEVSALQMLKRLQDKGLVENKDGKGKGESKRRSSIFRPNMDNQTNATHVDDRIGGPFLETDIVDPDEPVDTKAQEQMLVLANDMVSAIDRENNLYVTSDDDSASESDTSSDESLDGNFGIQDPPNKYVVFNPPLSSTDSQLARLRSKNQRDRFRAGQRALRSKEMIVLNECENALDSSNPETVKRACRMADALIASVGITALSSDLLRTFVELRRWGRSLGISKRKIDGFYPSGKAEAPKPRNFKPCCWRRENLVGSYMDSQSKHGQDVLQYSRDGSVADADKVGQTKKARAGISSNDGKYNRLRLPKSDKEHSLKNKEKPSAALQVLNDVASGSTKLTTPHSLKHEGSDSNSHKIGMTSRDSTESNQSIYGSLGGPTEEEICAANLTIFGVPQGRLGRIMRINIHGKSIHLSSIPHHFSLCVYFETTADLLVCFYDVRFAKICRGAR